MGILSQSDIDNSSAEQPPLTTALGGGAPSSERSRLGLGVLGAALPSIGPQRGRVVAGSLLARWQPPAHQDWRTWSWGRWQAWLAVAGRRDELRALAG